MPVKAKTAAARRPISAIRPDAIDRQRQAYVATIQQARSLGAGQNALLEKANSLLTVHWAHASWASRATILKTVDWLLQVALNNPSPNGRRREARG